MKKIVLLAVLAAITSSFSYDTDVYLCNSKNGKKYHFTKDCRGLSNCKAEVIKVTLTDAKKQGKELCGFED